MALALRRPSRRAPGQRAADGAAVEPARPARTRVAAARGAWAVGSVMLAIARLVRLVATVIVLIIVAAIILRVAGANAGNTIVHDVHSVAGTLAGPFKNVFALKNPKANMALNWGLAAVVYMVIGSLIAGLIARIAPRGVHPAQPVV
jgi:hypothetical protein